jgi:uncharacterized protein YdeI (YjbR/CyaY-like superfamily)
MQMNPKVDGYLRKHKNWQGELGELRRIVLDSPLAEEIKWRVPCYTLEGKTVAFLGAFKDCCTLSFVKGVLLKDPKRVLQKPGENTQSARVIRFTGVREIVELEPVLKALLREAVEVERASLKVDFKAKRELVIPTELREQMDDIPALKSAFDALTPGRQRAYVLYFSAAKQSKTRASRVQKCTKRILNGKGLDD